MRVYKKKTVKSQTHIPFYNDEIGVVYFFNDNTRVTWNMYTGVGRYMVVGIPGPYDDIRWK